MKIIMISNFFNHHQESFCDELYLISNNEFIFISLVEISKERIDMGWSKNFKKPYLIFAKNYSKEFISKLIYDADIVIASSGYEYYYSRVKHNKITFRYTERLFKESFFKLFSPIRIYKRFFREFVFFKKSNSYLLSVGDFCTKDFRKLLLFKDSNKVFKWGYFSNVESLTTKPDSSSIKFIWIGRLIKLKKPLLTLRVFLKFSKHIEVSLVIIGDGPLASKVNNFIAINSLTNVKVIPRVDTNDIKSYLDQAHYLIFTSNKKEGWGMVVSEALARGLPIISSNKVGSSSFLIKDFYNGYFHNNTENSLSKTLHVLLSNHKKYSELSKNAYNTIYSLWNSKIAAQRFYSICTLLINNNYTSSPYKTGPMSNN